MKKSQTCIWIGIISLIFLTGFDQYCPKENNASKNKSFKTSKIFEMPEVSIADVMVVRSDKGQKTAEVMVMLSKSASGVVTIDYGTNDGNALAGTDYVADSGSITFNPGETMKRLKVFIMGEAHAEPVEMASVKTEVTFQVRLKKAINAILRNQTALITIIKNIARDPRFSGKNMSVYEIVFTYTGYITFYGSLSDCPIRSNGTVMLTGLLSGFENVKSEEPIEYGGTLQLDIDMDICSLKEGDPAKFCGITVNGAGPVKVFLKIRSLRGDGIIQIKDTTSSGFKKNAVGSCDKEEIEEEQTMIPLKTAATIFNGFEFDYLFQNKTLRPGTYDLDEDNGKLVVNVLRKIR